MTEVLMGDALLELAKAKELACIMGGAWHDAEDLGDEEAEQTSHSCRPPTIEAHRNSASKPDDANGDTAVIGGGGNFFSRTLYRRHPSGGSSSHSLTWGSRHSHDRDSNGSSNDGGSGGGAASDFGRSVLARKRSGGGKGRARRPANGKAPGRRDPEAVARLEAAAAAARRAEEEDAQREGFDRSWQLPTNVDYYTDRAALLRELVKEMPADKRLSFQTRVANARTKEAIDSLLHDYAARLECLVLPHARSRDIDLQQVKKDTARERVIFDGEEVEKGDPSTHPHLWHEELWATVEARIMDGLLKDNGGGGANGTTVAAAEATAGPKAPVVVDKARVLAAEEWNKARAVAATSEVFKAMSRTGAGGDAYFALVALFCTADKLVVPVAGQESPIKVDFLHGQGELAADAKGKNKKSAAQGVVSGGVAGSAWKRDTPTCKRRGVGAAGRSREDVHVVVTVPSTFDIYLRDGQASSQGPGGNSGSGGAQGGGGGGGGSSRQRTKKVVGDAGADASIALHLVRVRAVVEEEIWVAGSARPQQQQQQQQQQRRRRPQAMASAPTSRETNSSGDAGRHSDQDAPPALRFLLDRALDGSRSKLAVAPAGVGASGHPSGPAAVPGVGGDVVSTSNGIAANAAALSSSSARPAPLTLTRTERRMRVSVVPEPSAVEEMVRSISRKIGVDVPGPDPPRVLGR